MTSGINNLTVFHRFNYNNFYFKYEFGNKAV